MAGITDEIASIAADRMDEPLTGEVAEGIESVQTALDGAAEAVREAVVDPEYARVTAARERIDRFQDHLLFERSACHAEDTLDVATHLAFRESPDVVTRNDR